MPSVAFILLLATLLPLLGFGVLLAVGKRMGDPLAGWLGTMLVGGSFLCSVLALFQWYSATAGAQVPQPWGFGDNGAAILLTTQWLPIGPPAAGVAPGPAHSG